MSGTQLIGVLCLLPGLLLLMAGQEIVWTVGLRVLRTLRGRRWVRRMGGNQYRNRGVARSVRSVSSVVKHPGIQPLRSQKPQSGKAVQP